MKTKLSQAIAAVAVMGAATAASAATVNPNGLGDTLLFPLYTVEAGNTTTLHLTNTEDSYKAVKVRFRRASDSYDVLDFNLYLSPNDMWTGVVTLGEDGRPVLQSGDNSCVSGEIGNELRDGKSFGRDDSTKGHIEVIEMANWTPAQAAVAVVKPDPINGLGGINDIFVDEAVEHNTAGVPGNCTAISDAWFYDENNRATAGFWSDIYLKAAPGENDNAASFNVNHLGFAPTGGLYGNAYVINVDEAWTASYAPTAMTVYNPAATAGNNHHMPRLGLPDMHGTVAVAQVGALTGFLADQALEGFEGTPSQENSVRQRLDAITVAQNNGMSQLGDANGTTGVDIAEVLATDELFADFSMAGSANANTELAITFPVKYAEQSLGGAATFGGNANDDQRFTVTFRDREEAEEVADPNNFQWSPWAPSSAAYLYDETNLIRLAHTNVKGDVLFAGRQDLGEQVVIVPSQFRNGWVNVKLVQDNVAAAAHKRPVIGLSNIVVKNDATPGITNTYGITHDLKKAK